MFSPRTLILECGLDRVALAVFSAPAGRLCLHELTQAPSAPVARHDGTVQSQWLEGVHSGLRSLAKLTSTRGPVTVVLPAPFSLLKTVKIPRLEPAQRERVLPFEAAENIPYALGEVAWGSAVAGETADEQEILLVAAKLELLESLCAAVAAAGFQPQVVLPAALAATAGFKTVQPAGVEARLGLHLGAGSTTLVLLERGRFAVRSFSLELDGPATLARLLQEITRSLLHFQWRSGLGKPALILLTGKGAGLPGLGDALAAKFTGPIQPLDLPGPIDFTDPATKRTATAQASTLLDLIGAAAIRLLPHHATINLLPPTVGQNTRRRQRRPWLVAAALLALAVLLPPLIHFHLLTTEAQKKTASLTRELVPWRARTSRIHEKLSQLGVVRQEIATLEAVEERRTRWPVLLAGLQEHLAEVEDAWLENLQVAPSVPGAPVKLLITGCLLDRTDPLAKASPAAFSRVKSLLNRLAEMPSVSAVESERFDPAGTGLLRFECVLVIDAGEPL